MRSDLRYAFRQFAKSPGLTFVITLILAIGIGANTAFFSVIKTLLFDSPFRDPERIVFVSEKTPEGDGASLSFPALREYQRTNGAFENLSGIRNQSWNLTGGKDPERVDGLQVSSTLFETLGIQPMLGRTFTVDEDRPGGAHVVVITEQLWQRRFGADPHVLGTTLTLDGNIYTVIGVLPRTFQLWQRADLVTPIGHAAQWTENWNWHSIYAVGRLAAGTSREQARTVLAAVSARLAKEHPGENANREASLMPLRDRMTGRLNNALWLLSSVSTLVLVLGCCNAAGLLQARGTARLQELSIRAALGATRPRLIRQMLVEGLLLGSLGTLTGLLLASSGVKLIATMMPRVINDSGLLRIDVPALCFGSLAGLLAGLAANVVPALTLTRTDMAGGMKRGALGTLRFGRLRVQDVLVVVQVSLAVVTLVGASLMARSFARLLAVPLGIEASGVTLADFTLPARKYNSPDDLRRFYRETHDELVGKPGVVSAAIMTTAPMSFVPWNAAYTIEGVPETSTSRKNECDYAAVSPDYFMTLGIRIREGRSFDAKDDERGLPVVIIDRSLARKHFLDGDVIGKRISLPFMGGGWLQIVGVSEHVCNWGPDGESYPEIFVPINQSPSPYFTLAVRTNGTSIGIAAALRGAVQRVDPDQPVANLRTMAEVVAQTATPRRLAAKLIVGFSSIALILAALGLYGTLSQNVIRRTREIGIRIALGATHRSVFSLIIGRGLALTSLGLLFGLCAAFPLTPLLSSVLYKTTPGDPLAFAAVPLVLLGIALIAAWWPARRATRIDPIAALRAE